MIITKLQIDSFGGLNRKSIGLSDGINIINGKNESGKSSVCDFIRFMLYGTNNVSEAAKFTSLATGKAAGSMTVRLDDSEAGGTLPHMILIEREYIPDITDKVKITDAVSGAEILKGIVPGEYLFGISSEFFYSTAYVSQLGGRSVSGREIGKSAENLLFSADGNIDTSHAIERLDDACSKLINKNGKDGLIPKLRTELSSLKLHMEEAEASFRELSEAENKLTACEEKISENSEKLQAADGRIKYCEAAVELLSAGRTDQVREKLNALKIRRQQLKNNTAYEGFLPTEAYIDRLEELDRTLKNEKARLANITAKHSGTYNSDGGEKLDLLVDIENAGGIRDTELRAENAYSKRKAFALLSVILFAVSAISLCAGVYITYIRSDINGIIPIIIGLTALIGTVITIISRKQATVEYYELLNLTGALDINDLYRILDDLERISDSISADRKRQDTENQSVTECKELIRSLSDELNELLSYWNMESAEQAMHTFSKFNIRLGEIDSEIRHQSEMLDESDNGADTVRREHLQKITAQNEHFVSEKLRNSLTDDSIPLSDRRKRLSRELDNARREHGFISGASEALMRKKHETELRITALRSGSEPIIPIKEKLDGIERQLETYEKMYAALSLAAEKLRSAAASLHSRITPAVTKRVSELLSELTDGKYSSVDVGSDLSMHFAAPSGCTDSKNPDADSSLTLDMQYMSGGTKDAAYIALRIALTELLCKENVPPLIFDESFCHIDDERLNRILRLINRLSENDLRQVLILSSCDRENRMMQHEAYPFNQITL